MLDTTLFEERCVSRRKRNRMGVMDKIPVGVMGATGLVGKMARELLKEHPLFRLEQVAASPSSAGKELEGRKLRQCLEITTPYVLSALPACVAKEVEPQLLQRGQHVLSNASAHRMDPHIPILIPEVNPSHLHWIQQQKTPGKMVTNSNCATVFAAMALQPLLDLGEVEHVSVVTLQGVSGAGYPGVSSLDILGNTIPYIPEEEAKICRELKKILGGDQPVEWGVTAQVHRVPVLHGHTVCLNVRFQTAVSSKSVREVLEGRKSYQVHDDPYQPQPAKVLTPRDMRVHIGRIQQGGDAQTVGLVAMGHNLVRGAAGAALLNLEVLHNHLEATCCASC